MTARHGRSVAAAVLLLTLTAACAESPEEIAADVGTASTSSSVEPRPDLMAATGAVIARDGVVTLCRGYELSRPPGSCGSAIVLAQVELAGLPGVESALGVTWSDWVRVVGTYDGDVLTAAEPPERVTSEGSPFPPIPPFACATPAGGWRAGGESGGPLRDAVRLYTQEHAATFAGSWWNQQPGVLTVTFTDDLAGHQRRLADLVGAGGACVPDEPARYTQVRLQEIAREVIDDKATLAERGIDVLGTGARDPEDAASINVTVADEATLAYFDERYGDAVEVHGWLEPA